MKKSEQNGAEQKPNGHGKTYAALLLFLFLQILLYTWLSNYFQ